MSLHSAYAVQFNTRGPHENRNCYATLYQKVKFTKYRKPMYKNLRANNRAITKLAKTVAYRGLTSLNTTIKNLPKRITDAAISG